MVGEELAAMGTHGKMLLLGGAVMLLQVGNRGNTQDVDVAFEENGQAIREAVANVAAREGLPADWLNDGAKGFLYSEPDTVLLGRFASLDVHMPTLDYLLAMKVVAGRRKNLYDAQALITQFRLQSPPKEIALFRK